MIYWYVLVVTFSSELLGGFFLLGISLNHHLFIAQATIIAFLLLDAWPLPERELP